MALELVFWVFGSKKKKRSFKLMAFVEAWKYF